MTREEIIKLAQECQLIGMRPHLDGIYQESLERFAALVAAAEREACLQIADQCADAAMHASMAANAIRARGKA